MTKHPKKKAPDPDPGDPNDETPKTEVPDSIDETTRRKRLLDKLFWIRIGMAAIAGTMATFLFEPIEGEERRWASIAFMIVVFIASAFVGKGMNIGLPPSDRKKIVTTGIGSYVFIYLLMWILTYTFIHHPDIGIGTIKPI